MNTHRPTTASDTNHIAHTGPTSTNAASATEAPAYLPFSFAAGKPSLHSVLNPDEHLGHEHYVVRTLRKYATAFPRMCLDSTPIEYQELVAALTGVTDGETPTVWTARLTYLLHMYADYIPTPECAFVEVASEDFHGWQDPNGQVVMDVLTTLRFNTFAYEIDTRSVDSALRAGLNEFGDLFLGVRLIVLDSPLESIWIPVGAGTFAQTLLASTVSPGSADLGAA